MLHQYRVEDASELLIDNGSISLPILTIALTVGYQSITPFNNAFRKLKELLLPSIESNISRVNIFKALQTTTLGC